MNGDPKVSEISEKVVVSSNIKKSGVWLLLAVSIFFVNNLFMVKEQLKVRLPVNGISAVSYTHLTLPTKRIV